MRILWTGLALVNGAGTYQSRNSEGGTLELALSWEAGKELSKKLAPYMESDDKALRVVLSDGDVLTALEAENAKLKEALALTSRFLGNLPDSTESFECLAAWFHEETGLLAPGKDWPDESPPNLSEEEIRQEWNRWRAAKKAGVLRAAREALKGGGER